MKEKSILNLKSLKDQVYEYLRDQMEKGNLLPGSYINMEETSKKLGISKTPLRDALLQLEMENFVTIIPRRGVIVNPLTLKDIKDYYEIIGSLESQALLSSFPKLKKKDVDRMFRLNQEMAEAITNNNFNLYYQKNVKFHDIFLAKCGNEMLIRIVNNLKKRLYDFPRQEGFVKEWEETSIGEHQQLVNLIDQGNKEAAVNFIRDVHWSYKVQEKFIKKYYKQAAVYAERSFER
ncbi:MAG: GntR family transcriptional regulator [Candidatus Aminicenantes bacterium]|nr:MAG: GntR family transcriptional regulator [Candidatus Aminicenantes bacterium]